MSTSITPTIRSEYIDLTVADNTSMRVWTARVVDTDAQSGVMVFQEAFGVNAHIRDVADRFAREGYVAIAPELYHRTAPGLQGRYDNLEGVLPHARAVKSETLELDARAAYDWLRANFANDGRIAAVGFCMGGRVAFLAALAVRLACGVSFYGTGIAPREADAGLLGRAAELHCPMLFFWGGQDEHIPPEEVEAVKKGLRSAAANFVNVEIAEARHGFFCDPRESYNPRAAALAWQSTLTFLTIHLNGGWSQKRSS